jgi:hypothetical protein
VLAENAGGQADYETRRIYASLKTDLQRSLEFSYRIDTLQLGCCTLQARVRRHRDMVPGSGSPIHRRDSERNGVGATAAAVQRWHCHLAPGMEDNEMRPGLYPYPPNLAAHRRDAKEDPQVARASAARQFWIIKHGIKMSAMPAWGKTHDDATIWGIVAFVQKLSMLTPQQYGEMTKESESVHEARGHGSMQGAHEADTDRAKTPADRAEPDTRDQHRH